MTPCPFQHASNATLWLDYSARRLSSHDSDLLHSHLATCPSCRHFAAAQRAVWVALDQFQPAASLDFDRRLIQRIHAEGRPRWFDGINLKPFAPLAAAAALWFALAPSPHQPPQSQSPLPVEQILADVDMLDQLRLGGPLK